MLLINFAWGRMSDCFKCIFNEICSECKNNKILNSERKWCINNCDEINNG